METIDILKTAVSALNAKKAFDLKVIKIDNVTILADYFVLVTGSSSTQVKSLANEVDYKLSEKGVEPSHIEGKSSGWILLDYGNIIVHIMQEQTREFYALERLWDDAPRIDVELK